MQVKRSRILALDLLRGYFIFVIIINHLAWQTNLFEPFTGKGGLWATAAEGFFTVSGILVGYIYGPKILSATGYVFKRIWRRAILLYALFLASTLIFTALALATGSPHVPPGVWQGGSAIDLLMATVSFNYLYGLNDFLSRYALFMLIAPFVLWCIATYRGRGVFATILTSLTVWILLQPHVHTSSQADILIWQIVFMPSIAIGFYLPSIEQWFARLKPVRQKLLVAFLVTTSTITYLLSYIYTSYNSLGLVYWLFSKAPALTDPIVTFVRIIGDSVAPVVDKQSLGWLALVTGICWFWTLYILTRRYENSIDRLTRGVLAFIGRNSLTAYVVHAFVIFFVTLVAQNPGGGDVVLKTVVSFLVVALSVGITWVFVYTRRMLLEKR